MFLQLSGVKRKKTVDFLVLCFGRLGFSFSANHVATVTICWLMFESFFRRVFWHCSVVFLLFLCLVFDHLLVLFGGETGLPDGADFWCFRGFIFCSFFLFLTAPLGPIPPEIWTPRFVFFCFCFVVFCCVVLRFGPVFSANQHGCTSVFGVFPDDPGFPLGASVASTIGAYDVVLFQLPTLCANPPSTVGFFWCL